MSDLAVGLEDVRAAAERIAPHVHRTPVHRCRTLDRRAGRELHLKCEQWQRGGAFKFRGACNAVLQLSEDAVARGVATHSSGNHAQALALAAALRGAPAHVVMPRDAAGVKRRAVLEAGARLVECEPSLEARERTAARVVEETGAALVHPYDHPHVIAGQGTVGLELLEQVEHLDAIVVPVGGGGLIAGIATAALGLAPRLRVFGAEPRAADDAARSKRAGRRIELPAPRTVADGLLANLGELTWPVVRDRVEDVVTVSEEEILDALRLAWERAKLLIEPSAAVALAAALSADFRARTGLPRVAVVLTGGNVDLDRLPR